MGGLGLFFTHELPLCCDHDYYCFCPSHSKFPVGCGFHMLKASWGHLNVLYFNSYSLLIVICWCIYDISHIHSLSNKYNLRTSSLMLLPLISSSISIPMLSCFLCLSVHILQTAENKNRKKLLSCLIHVINYIIILHARNYCDIWYINNWHINFNLSSKYSI